MGDGSKWGLKIRYSREDKPLGTAGPIALFDGLQDNFLVMNGDILTNLTHDVLEITGGLHDFETASLVLGGAEDVAGLMGATALSDAAGAPIAWAAAGDVA